MSALTKIFVVLLVIMVLWTTAAEIVFVNRQENYMAAAKQATSQKLLVDAKVRQLEQDILKANGEKVQLGTEMKAQNDQLKATIAADIQTQAQLQGQIAEKDQAITQLTAQGVSQAEALKTAQADIKTRTEAYTALLNEKDRVQQQESGSENRITELTNEKDIMIRRDKYVTEQIAQLQQENARLNEILHRYNISPTGNQAPAGGAINSTPAVNINGIVRDFKNINGVPFATISLGSADAVTHGMKFSVIDPVNNKWLGYLTVDTVGVHDATGRLDGPGVNNVKPNVSEVRTQL